MEREFSLAEINEIATWFWKQQPAAKVYAFVGDMGAGKTTFIHALCDAMGVTDTVGSPTFSIINEYACTHAGHTGTIYHMDLYRLKNEDEAIQAGVEDCLYSGHICLVEWPDRAQGIFPPDTVFVTITLASNGKRLLRIGRN